MSDMDKKIADAVKESEKPREGEITLSSGVVLKVKQVPPGMFIKVLAKHKRPPVYTYKDQKSNRLITNPDHPDYIEAVKAWETEYAEALLNAMILLGTEVISTPRNVHSHMSQKWLDEYEALEMETFPDNERWRYLNWVLSKALETDEDYTLLQQEVGRLSGVPEKDVSEAEDFPGSDEAG